MDILNKHVTIRKFKNRVVDKDLVRSIIYDGTRASTTGNMQLYSVVVSSEKEQLEKLYPLHFNQPVIKSAPLVLTVLADVNRFSLWCEQNNAVPTYNNLLWFYTASIDALLVAQNICIAAENNGLGICYLGTTSYNAKEIISTQKLPKLTFPVTTIAMGYPDENPKLTDRIPLDGIVHYEHYKNYGDEFIKQLYEHKESLPESIQFVNENNKETLAQVFTEVRYKKSDNLFFSEKLKKTIKEQGFIF